VRHMSEKTAPQKPTSQAVKTYLQAKAELKNAQKHEALDRAKIAVGTAKHKYQMAMAQAKGSRDPTEEKKVKVAKNKVLAMSVKMQEKATKSKAAAEQGVALAKRRAREAKAKVAQKKKASKVAKKIARKGSKSNVNVIAKASAVAVARSEAAAMKAKAAMKIANKIDDAVVNSKKVAAERAKKNALNQASKEVFVKSKMAADENLHAIIAPPKGRRLLMVKDNWPIPLSDVAAKVRVDFPAVFNGKPLPKGFSDQNVAKLVNQVAAHAGQLQAKLNKMRQGPSGGDTACLNNAHTCQQSAPGCAESGSGYANCRPLIVACMQAVEACKLKLKGNPVVSESLGASKSDSTHGHEESDADRVEALVDTIFPK